MLKKKGLQCWDCNVVDEVLQEKIMVRCFVFFFHLPTWFHHCFLLSLPNQVSASYMNPCTSAIHYRGQMLRTLQRATDVCESSAMEPGHRSSARRVLAATEGEQTKEC